MKIPSTTIQTLTNLLESKSQVLITSHYNPDGDAIGSSLALYHYLNNKGINSNILIPNELPSYLQWMQGCEQVQIFSSNPQLGEELILAADLIFCVDFNGIGRVKLFTEQLRASKAFSVLIDHHPEPEQNFDLIISTTEISSTSELIYKILEGLEKKNFLSREVAECLYIGIMTDTGSFSYACNQPDTFLIIAELIKSGVEVERLHRLVYDTYSEDRMRLLGFCLGERLKVLPEYATAYMWLSMNDLRKYNYKQGDTEGVVNYALSIQNVAFAALFTEREDRIRVSLRSKGDFAVNKFADRHWDGGGHKNAAGADIFLPMPEALSHFEILLPQYQVELKQSLSNYQ